MKHKKELTSEPRPSGITNPLTNAGFTLLEILIALSVFAILATITSSALYHAFNTRSHIQRQSNRLNKLQLAMALIRRDAQQIVDRPVRGNQQHAYPALIGESQYPEFTRGGDINPNTKTPSSTLARIAYVCAQDQLIRRSWQALDTTHRNTYHDKILINHLDQCKFAYLSHNQQVLSEWRENALKQNQQKEPLPKAIQFTLNLEDRGNMSLLFIIPEALYAE